MSFLRDRTTRFEDHPYAPVQEGGLSENTIRCHVTALKAFGTWLAEEGYTQDNIFKRLKKPKKSKRLIEVLTKEEIEKLLSVLSMTSHLGARCRAIVALFWTQACG